MVFVLSDKIFASNNDFILACENRLTIAFGAAIITLNRSREEAEYRLPDPIVTEADQFVSVVYQIRNAFAHDIAEPKWHITQDRYRRAYQFGGWRIDLTGFENGRPFRYEDVGGPDILFHMHQYGMENVFRAR